MGYKPTKQDVLTAILTMVAAMELIGFIVLPSFRGIVQKTTPYNDQGATGTISNDTVVIDKPIPGKPIQQLSTTTQQPKQITVSGTDINVANVLDLVNNERVAQGLQPLHINNVLSAAARAKLDDMVKRGYFAHNTPNGQLPWIFFNQLGYQYKRAGENLAEGNWTVQEMVNTWLNSPPHLQNILNAGFTDTGISIGNCKYVLSGQAGEDSRLAGQDVKCVIQFFASPINNKQ